MWARGNNWFFSGNLPRAVSDFEAAARLMPNERDAFYNLGVSCLHQGDRVGGVHAVTTAGVHVVSPNDAWYRRAIEAFTRALELAPGDTKSLVMRG